MATLVQSVIQSVIVLCAWFLLWAPFSAAAEEPNCPFGLTANEIAASSGLDLAGKTCLVTGGRSGLGYAVAEALMWQNCTVVIASRNLEKNQEAVASLKTTVPGADVSYQTFDLEDFNSIREFATAFNGNHTRLDYYFANAGQGGSGAQPLTVDGYERIFQVNYVGQFLLIQLLLPLIRQSQPSRILFTGSSTHSMSCGTVGMGHDNIEDDDCFDETVENNLISSVLPFDETGLGKIDSTFQCPPLNGAYPITKQLFIHLAKELSKREAEAGNEVYIYSWAPGSIKTKLNPWAFCCNGPFDTMGTDSCHYILPFVGPTDDQGSPDPAAFSDHWVSSAHGAMGGLYAALHATPEEAGTFFATYNECANDKGLYLQGLTLQGREQLYEDSMVWAGLAEPKDAALSGETAEMEEEEDAASSGETAEMEEEEEGTSSVGYQRRKEVAMMTSLGGIYAML